MGVAVGAGLGVGVGLDIGSGVGVVSGLDVGVEVDIGSGVGEGSGVGVALALTEGGDGVLSVPVGGDVLLGLQALNSDRVHRVARVTGKRSLADIMLCIMRASYGLYF